jgi:hypothetical protein
VVIPTLYYAAYRDRSAGNGTNGAGPANPPDNSPPEAAVRHGAH